jgi:hypothetical protein
MEDMRNQYVPLSQNLKSLWRFNMAMDLTETGCEGVK